MTVNTLSKIVTQKDIEKVKMGDQLISMALRLPCQCNFNCKYCYGKTLTKKEVLTLSEITNLLYQARDLKTRTIEIVGEGEPLLYPQFRKLIIMIHRLNMISTLYSNCSQISEEIASFLFNHNVTVIGKQNFLNEVKQDNISNHKGAYKKLMKGLHNLISVGFTNTNPSRLAIHTVVLKDNIKDIPILWRQWRRKNILPQVQALVYPSKKQDQLYHSFYRKQVPSPNQLRRLFEELSSIDNQEFGIDWDPVSAYPIAPDSCRVLYGTIGITQEGNVQICSYTEDPIENIREKSIKQILQMKKVKKIRNTSECLKYSNNAYGCRANAFNITGNRFASDPYYDKFISKS